MPLQLRRGSDAERIATTFAQGEPVWTTDTNKLFVGDGVTPGAIEVAGGGGGSSTSTYYNLTVTNQLTVTGMSISTSSGGGGTVNINVNSEANNYIRFKPYIAFDGSVGIATNQILYVDNIRANDATNLITINDETTITNTLTVTTIKFGDGTTMSTAATGGGASTSTYYNLTVTNQLSVGDPSSSQLNISKSGAVFLVGSSNSGDSIRLQDHDYLYLNPTSAVIINESNPGQSFLNVNTIRPSGTYTNVTFNGNVNVNAANTLTVAGMTVGVSNAVLIPNVILSSSTNVLVQTPPTSGGHIIFGMNRFGLQRPLAITRTGGIAFDFGQQIFPGQGANVGNLSIQAASTSSGTANTLFLSSGGITGSGPLARGVFSDASGLTIGTRPSGGATAFNSSVFDLNGGLTLPKSLVVGTTATVAGLVLGSDPVITSRSELIGPTGPTGPTGQSSSIYDYKAKTTITSGDPGSNYLIWNNATQQSATEIILSHIDFNGEDIEYLLGFLTTGDSIRIQDQLTSENYQDWLITGPAVTTTASYVTVPVSLTTSTHSFGNNDRVVVINRVAGAVGPTGATGPQGPGADQSLNTTSNVTFANANITTRIDASAIYANATTQDLSLTANFNGAGSGAGGSVNIFSANGSAALPKVEILGDAINFKSADSTVNYGGFGFDTGLSVSTTATVGALRFGTETAITSRSELIGPTGPAGDPGATGPTGPAGATGGYSGTESVYALGNTSGTLSVDATSATIFTMTLNGNLTMNAITNVVTGTNATFVITQDGTGGRTLTSSWKFAGGAKTLTTAGTATDMISVFYDGSNYWASLSRGFV